MRPIQAGSGEQLDLVAIDPRMHAVAVLTEYSIRAGVTCEIR
jgi:hypothetical protein